VEIVEIVEIVEAIETYTYLFLKFAVVLVELDESKAVCRAHPSARPRVML
jgi:hypothetical protein